MSSVAGDGVLSRAESTWLPTFFFGDRNHVYLFPGHGSRAIQVLSARYQVLFWCLAQVLQPGIIFTMSFLAVYFTWSPMSMFGSRFRGEGDMKAVRILYTCTHIGYVWAWLVLKAVYFGSVWKVKGWVDDVGRIGGMGRAFLSSLRYLLLFGLVAFTTGFRDMERASYTYIQDSSNYI